MTSAVTVADCMVSDLCYLAPDTEISRALGILLERRISGAPVLDDTGELIGLLTKKDCFKAALNAAYYKQWGGVVEHYMTRDLHTLQASLDIVSAAEAFLALPYRSFPVLRDGRLVGLVSRSDLLAAFMRIGG